MYLQITVSINDNNLQNYTFDQPEVIIGRGTSCDIRLDNPGVSRNHAKLIHRDDTLQVVDLQSGNGTFVNDERVQRKTVTVEDTIRVGKFTLGVQLIDEELPDTGSQDSSEDEADSYGNGDNKTVSLRPHETQKILQQSQAAKPIPAAPPTYPSDTNNTKGTNRNFTFWAGAVVGLFVGWLLWF